MKRYITLAAVAGMLALSACADTTEAESTSTVVNEHASAHGGVPGAPKIAAEQAALAECKDQPITRWWDCAIDVAKAADDGTTTTTEPEYETFMYEVAAVSEAGVVGDDGTSITFDTRGEERDYALGDDIEGIAIALSMLGTPDRVIAHIDQTRALDGTQDDSWEFDGVDYAAFWNYHPDSGMNLTVYES